MPTSRLLRRTKKTRTILVRPNRTSCPLFSLLGFPPYSTPTNKGGIRLTVHVDVAVAVDVQVQTALRGAAPISLGGVISATGSRLLYSQRVRLVRGTVRMPSVTDTDTATATATANSRPRLRLRATYGHGCRQPASYGHGQPGSRLWLAGCPDTIRPRTYSEVLYNTASTPVSYTHLTLPTKRIV